MLDRLRRLVRAFAQRGSPLGNPPPEVGVYGLAPCPDTPNCVSSKSDDPDHYVEPIAWGLDGSAIAAVEDYIWDHPRAELHERRDDYLHATFRIPVFGFVDDIEFLWDENEGFLHVRSASRVGRRDLGVNRRRVERIRKALANR